MVVGVLYLGIEGYVCVDVGHIIQGGGVGRPPPLIGDVVVDPLCRQYTGGFPAQGGPFSVGQATSEVTLCNMVVPPLGGWGRRGVCRSQVWRRRSCTSLKDGIW